MACSSYVYFLRQIGGQGPVKIGSSIMPEARLHHYMLWSPYPLEIAAKYPGNSKTEARFHALFEHLHSHHEWFLGAPEIDAVIAEIRAGTFSDADLPDRCFGPKSRSARTAWNLRALRKQAA